MDQVLSFLLQRDDHGNCTKDTCPVQDSVYGYYPSKPVNVILVVLFTLSMIAHLYQGMKARAWTFAIALGLGTLLEAIGYVGRLLMRNDPFSRAFLGIQLVCLTVAPALITAGIYLTLKHIIIVYGAQFSRIAPKNYTRIFITCDVLSIVIQTLGASLAASSAVGTGNTVMMLGLVSQVITLAIFGLMAYDVFRRVRKHQGRYTESAEALRSSSRFKGFLIAITVAYFTVFLRCVYRIAEMAGGWGNPIMQDQIAFVILDGVMCVVAVLVLNVYHPGFLFEQSYATAKTENIHGEDMVMV